MTLSVPRAHIVDRRRIWRLVAAVLIVTVSVTGIEIWARPDAWRPALTSAAFPSIGAPLAWFLGPRLTPRHSYRIGLAFLVLGVVAATISLIGWRGTPMAGAVSFYYVLIIVFAALFFHRRDVVALAALSAVALGAGVTSDGFSPDDLLLWTLAASVVASTGHVLHDMRHTAERLSYADALTGAANRREWNLVVTEALREHDRVGGPLAVVLIDIDAFKSINDTEGHERGDEVLATAVTTWRGVIRPGDLIARLGGDEFGILLHNVRLERAHEIGEHLLAAFRTATGFSCSIGIAAAVQSGSARDLFSHADRQLYEAKGAGRGCVRSVSAEAASDSRSGLGSAPTVVAQSSGAIEPIGPGDARTTADDRSRN